MFARDYNEALVHQIVVAFQANARQGTRAQKAAPRSTLDEEALAPEGTAARARGMTSSPLWRGVAGSSRTARTRTSHKVNKRCTAPGSASIFSQLGARIGSRWSSSISVDSPKTKQLAAKFKAMGLDSVFVIADQVDENLLLASRNLPNVLSSSRDRSAVARAVQQGARDQGGDRATRGDAGMSAVHPTMKTTA